MENGYKWQMYKDLLKLDNVRMCKGAVIGNNPILHKLHKIHWSAKINEKINLPFKRIWFKKMTNGKFNNGKPTCFILFGGQYGIRESKLLDYIKKIDPNNRIVIHYRDVIGNESKYLDSFKSKCDLIYTYNKIDVETYGVDYFCSYIYSKEQEVTSPDTFKYDLYFVGYTKGRLSFLIELCKHLKNNNVKCLFKIAGVAKNERIKQDGIEYLDKPIPYSQVINDIQDSRCILELMQPNSDGATLRTLEAITYKRKLLTNGCNISKREFFCKEQMCMFSTIKSIDIDFITSPLKYDKFLNVDSFSPIRELQYLENKLSVSTTQGGLS